MTYQTNLKIKEEPFSPYTPSLPCSDGTGMYSVVCTGPNSNMVDQCQTTHSDGSPAKRFKSESEEVALQNPETMNKLKNLVLDRRLAQGDVNPLSNLFEEPKENELTPEDLDRRAKRKKQNREAAKRCRDKKKQQQNRVAQDTAQVEQDNERLRQILCDINQDIHKVGDSLFQHLECGDCKLSSQIQDEHKQLIKQFRFKLQSLVQQEQLLQKTCPEAHLVAEYGHETESNGESYQSTDTSNSGLEVLPRTNDVHKYRADFSETVSVDNAGDNLQSWDLDNINPDIPIMNMVPCLKQYTSDLSIDDADSVEQLPYKNISEQRQHNHHHVPVTPSCMTSFTDDVFNVGSSTLFITPTQASGQETIDKTYPNIPHVIEHNQKLSPFLEPTRTAHKYACVSPNLVQPVSTRFHPTTCLPTTILNCNSIYTPTRGIHQNSIPADVNNNPKSRTTPDKTVGQHGFDNIYSSYDPPQYFTFDCEPDTPILDVTGNEPISPFYTQGGNSRL